MLIIKKLQALIEMVAVIITEEFANFANHKTVMEEAD